MKFQILTILLFCLLITGQLFAQTDRVERRRIEITDHERQLRSGHSGSFGRIAVTMDFTKTISGEIPMSVQVPLTDWFLVEAGLGLTWRNYFLDWVGSGGLLVPEFGNSLSTDEPYDINPSYRLAMKFFPMDGIFDDEYYLGIQYSYRKYNISYDLGGESLESGHSYGDLSLLYGQQITTMLDRIFIDAYLGGGLRYIENYEIVERYDSGTGELIGYDQAQTPEVSPGFVMGIKIGFVAN